MTEIEKIAYAKSFIDKLAEGINPIDNKPIPDGDVVNNVRLSRCFFYVSDVLRQVIENGGVVTVKQVKQKKCDFCLTNEERMRLKASDIPLTVSDISKLLNGTVDLEKKKRISAAAINSWLMKLGFIKSVETSNGKQRKIPTDSGNEIGIFTEERAGQYGTYVSVLFSAPAQEFIFDNIESIVEAKRHSVHPIE